jgi:hypothetical protein
VDEEPVQIVDIVKRVHVINPSQIVRLDRHEAGWDLALAGGKFIMLDQAEGDRLAKLLRGA